MICVLSLVFLNEFYLHYQLEEKLESEQAKEDESEDDLKAKEMVKLSFVILYEKETPLILKLETEASIYFCAAADLPQILGMKNMFQDFKVKIARFVLQNHVLNTNLGRTSKFLW